MSCNEWVFSGGSEVKNPLANVGGTGDVGSIPGWGRYPGVGNGNPPQYSCLENSTPEEGNRGHPGEEDWGLKGQSGVVLKLGKR